MKEKYEHRLKKGIELYSSGKSMTASAELATISVPALQRHLKKLGLVRSNKINSRRYKINHDFFEKIESEKTAYWLGFIYADGFLSNRKYQKVIGISLGSRDKNHLAKFLEDTDANYLVKDYKTTSGYKNNISYSRVYITSEKMFSDLLKAGVLEKKSLKLQFPTWMPSTLKSHFIRGYFDGDGSFAKNSKGTYTIKMCGTKEFLKSVLKIFGKENLKLHKARKDKKNTYYISICGMKQIKRIADYLYNDATIYLDRKHERYNLIKQFKPK